MMTESSQYGQGRGGRQRGVPSHRYRPAWWIPGRHLQTLWGKFVRRRPLVATRTERWDTTDGDFLDVVRLDAPPGRPRLVILHGLEGSANSHYARGLLDRAGQRGWAADVLVFRSCGAEPNRLLRSYHSGETCDLDFVVERVIAETPTRPIALAGVSLGGNVLLKWLGERGETLPKAVVAAATMSVPYDLALGARELQRGFARVYQAHFLRSLRRKAIEKSRRFANAPRADQITRLRTIYDFDDVVTGPIHGFESADDYYVRSSSIRWLERIRLPTLMLSAEDDPFLPSSVLDDVRQIARQNPMLELEFVPHGGHVGFVAGAVPWRPFYFGEWRVIEFLAAHLARVEGPQHGG